MAESIKRTIDGNDYEITPFMGMHGWKLQMRLGKIIGPGVKEALAAMPKGDVSSMMDGEIDPAMLGGGISALIDAISTSDAQGDLVMELLSQTQRNGVLLTKGNIDSAFAANYGEMFKAIIGVVNANNFFGIASFGLANALQKMAGANQEG